MSDADALLAAVLADPDADLPRLVYADWLDEHGQSERAEFIRVQIALASDPGNLGLDVREQTLLALHATDWLKALRARGEPLHSSGTHGQFRRGFVEVVWMPAGEFLHRADKLFRRIPVRALRVTQTTRSELRGLLAAPTTWRLRELDFAGLDGRMLANECLTAAARFLPPVLRARNCQLSDANAAVLTDIDVDWRPDELDVSLNPLSDLGLANLRYRFGAAVRFDR